MFVKLIALKCGLLLLLILLVLPQASAGTVPAGQVNALEMFYYTTNGPFWIWQQNYSVNGIPWDVTNVSANPCLEEWQGVSCTANCSTLSSCDIVGLELSMFNLTGPLSTSLVSLPQLRTLDFSFNLLYGPIPSQMGSMTTLTGVSISFNLLSGNLPTTLGQLISMGSLDVSSNFLSGSLPSQLGNMAQLT